MQVIVIGGGLAGCEAAWALANRGIEVVLYEMKPTKYSPAHHNENLAELVCSNSLKAARVESAAGLLKAEMRLLGSLLLDCADKCAVPAGGALAVDRNEFSKLVTEAISNHPKIKVIREEVLKIPKNANTKVIIAAGPLASDVLSEDIRVITGQTHLSFFDAAAPIVTFESIDMTKAFFAARYGRGDDDYINCPMNSEEYDTFYDALVEAERAPLKEFETFKVYEGCMPVEVLASRGRDSIRYGPLKPVGLTDPRTERRPWAVVQLRAENAEGSLYNLVGFQTNLKFGEQKRVFSLIPGLENAEFVRYGVMHRNTFINSPVVTDGRLKLLSDENIRFAGQITGVEGYLESAMTGIVAGQDLVAELLGEEKTIFPHTTMTGALLNHTKNATTKEYQPLGASMGLLPRPEVRIKDKQERYRVVADVAIADMKKALKKDEADS